MISSSRTGLPKPLARLLAIHVIEPPVLSSPAPCSPRIFPCSARKISLFLRVKTSLYAQPAPRAFRADFAAVPVWRRLSAGATWGEVRPFSPAPSPAGGARRSRPGVVRAPRRFSRRREFCLTPKSWVLSAPAPSRLEESALFEPHCLHDRLGGGHARLSSEPRLGGLRKPLDRVAICSIYVLCVPKARLTSGGRFHPESCRLIW